MILGRKFLSREGWPNSTTIRAILKEMILRVGMMLRRMVPKVEMVLRRKILLCCYDKGRSTQAGAL